MGCLLIKEAMFANYILFATFCTMGTLVRRRKTWRYSAPKVTEFGLLMADIPVYVSRKFEMCIFKIALVLSENVCIAFLYVLSIFPVALISVIQYLRNIVPQQPRLKNLDKILCKLRMEIGFVKKLAS